MANTSKCSKQDYVVLEVVHTATRVGFSTERYMTWHVVRVESATREGIAKTVRKSPAERSTLQRIDNAFHGRVLCLPHEMQGAALRTFLTHPEDGFRSDDEVKATLRRWKATESKAA